MKIGIAQMNSRLDKDNNLLAAEILIDSLAAKGAELVLLPEYFNFVGPENLWRENAEILDTSPSLARIRQKAIDYKVYIHSGSVMERDGEKIYNTSLVFDPEGRIVARYRKIHLFDVEVPGGRKYFESDNITAGEDVVVFTIGDITFGLATCYDLRFPELFRSLAMRGAQVVLLPAAFTLMTGRDHWERLVRARAVENLCYMVAADQFGSCPPNHLSYGRSMIVDPWGVVLSQAGDGERVITADIEIEHLRKLRQSFPVLDHIRSDLFGRLS